MPVSINGSGPIDGITSLNTTVSSTELGYLDGVNGPILTDPGVWTSYTPTITGFTVGNGSISGKYTQIGKTVIFRAVFILGSTSGKPNGSTQVSISIPPISMADGMFDLAFMNAVLLDSGTGYFPLVCYGNSIWVFNASTTYGSITHFSSTVPISFATNDAIFVSGIYEGI